MSELDTVRSALAEAADSLARLQSDTAMLERIAQAGALLADTFAAGGRAYSCGNGGSMCDAMHFAEELTGRFRDDRRGYAALAISDPGHLSCVGNDYGYERVFARFIEAHGRAGDVLLAITTSGTSRNVVAAAQAAQGPRHEGDRTDRPRRHADCRAAPTSRSLRRAAAMPTACRNCTSRSFTSSSNWSSADSRLTTIEPRMPRRSDLKSILIIGAGPIVIGQACEFDYSGAQACKALKQEGYKVILVNSNPATIMTDPETADVTYIEPITWQVVERIIAKEKPEAILPTMGGQTALNCAMDLYKNGVLHKHGVELIGASPAAIEKAEDRLKFKEAMTSIGLASARSTIAHTMDEALGGAEVDGLSGRGAAELHAGRHRRRHRLEHGGVRCDLHARAGSVADARAADRGIADRLEGIRDGSGPRQGGQLHHRVLDREPRSDGHPYGRLDHGGAGADADGQGIPADARRQHRDPARDRRRHRRQQRAVRDQSRRTAG